eukprot:1961518-Rhodomonas_salina.1
MVSAGLAFAGRCCENRGEKRAVFPSSAAQACVLVVLLMGFLLLHPEIEYKKPQCQQNLSLEC